MILFIYGLIFTIKTSLIMIPRGLQKNIISACFKNKVILLIGARQVGKTTLLKEITKKID